MREGALERYHEKVVVGKKGQEEEQEPEHHRFMSGFSLLGSGPDNLPLINPLTMRPL